MSSESEDVEYSEPVCDPELDTSVDVAEIGRAGVHGFGLSGRGDSSTGTTVTVVSELRPRNRENLLFFSGEGTRPARVVDDMMKTRRANQNKGRANPTRKSSLF